MFQDLRYGARMLLKSKGFTAVAALTLALGVGANTALFSVMDAVMLKTLPVRDPEQLVVLRCLDGAGWYKSFIGSNPRDPGTGLRTTTSMSYPAFERFRWCCWWERDCSFARCATSIGLTRASIGRTC